MCATLSEKNFGIIIKYVKKLCPNKRTPKYTNEYYLTNILDLLDDFVSWRSLKKSINYKNGEMVDKSKIEIIKDNHYKTICAKHNLWTIKKVYEKAYTEITKNTTNAVANKNQLQLIIDATNIINKSGVEGIGYGSECKKKKFTKLTVISDNNGILLSVIANQTNDKMIKFKNSDKEISITTLEHDIKGIVPALNDLKINKKKIKISLCADKGYISGEEMKNDLINNHNTTLITPYRKNQKKQNTEDEKQKLKTRSKVENAIAKLKKCNRVHVRRDKLLRTYMSFVYLSFFKVS
jgi:hypothetical protein